jgi:hypothetical protein
MTVAAWVTRGDLPESRPVLPGGDAEWDGVCDLASGVLFGLSGRRWAGRFTKTIQVFASQTPWWWQRNDLGLTYDTTWGTCLWGGSLPALPMMVGGELFNHSGCDRPPSIRLPDYPVQEVTAVRIGGAVRDPSSYQLIGSRYLEDGWDGWPTCGWSPDGVAVMEVDYVFGATPPAAGTAAARSLALELGKARAGQPSALPGYVYQRVRQGITESFVRADSLFDKGRTGLPEVDLWLATVNPGRLRQRSRTWSPDTDPRYRTTATGGTP